MIDPRFALWFAALFEAGWTVPEIADGYGVPPDSIKMFLS